MNKAKLNGKSPIRKPDLSNMSVTAEGVIYYQSCTNATCLFCGNDKTDELKALSELRVCTTCISKIKQIIQTKKK